MFLLLACAASREPLYFDVEDGGEDCGTLDWAGTGAPFVLTYCASCHSSRQTGATRHGATAGVDLDTLAGVEGHLERVAARVADSSMPPAGGPTQAEKDRFAAWIACGAPGDETGEMPDATGDERTLRGAWEVNYEVAEEDGVLISSFEQTGQGTTSGLATIEVEHWLVDDRSASLARRERYDDDGNVLFVDEWEPSLRVLLPGEDEWTERVRRTRDGDSVDQVWTFTRGSDPEQDPRFDDPDTVYILGIEDRGDEVAFHLSEDRGVVGRHFRDAEDPGGEVWQAHLFGALLAPDPLPDFPLEDGQNWAAGVLAWDE